ncbi:hypothetical protein, variant [Verruconis gallopava]|nr:hypothetical protein, variant [Verruconis gallopava]KIW04968.1 hypothetical protein, variant [Verruconis gallopava]
MVFRGPRGKENTLQSDYRRFLNSTCWDVALSEDLEAGKNYARHLRTMRFPRPSYLSPAVVSAEESQLLLFFNESRSLMLGPTDEEVLAHFIMRIAFSDAFDTTNPVLQAVFALASLQLHGSLKSFRYKRLVMSSVKEPTDWIDEKTLLQNLTSMMLLYHHELSLESNSKGSWVTFLCAVKRIINTSPGTQKLVRQENSVFLDWIFYHEALAEFTVRHWAVPYEGCGYVPIPRSPNADNEIGSKKRANIGCTTDVLQLTVYACTQAVVAKSSAKNYANIATEQAEMLERQICRAVGDYGPIHDHSAAPADRNAMVLDLHRLACLIYVNRAVRRVAGTEFHHRRLVREGILLLTRMATCQNAWPLFIIACEAVNEDQRLALLDVFEKSLQERRRRSSHIHFIQHIAQAVWNQHDLNPENPVDYLTILDAVIGGLPFMPPFA